MTLETETVLDRRRLRRHVTGWRAAAVAALAIAIGAIALSGDRRPVSPVIRSPASPSRAEFSKTATS